MQTILLVDDDPAIRIAWSRILRLGHYDVTTASDAYAALDVANAVKPAVIVTDRDMRGMDGIELCRRIKLDPKFEGTPIVLASADDVAALCEPIWDEYWQKPVPTEVMLASIARLLTCAR